MTWKVRDGKIIQTLTNRSCESKYNAIEYQFLKMRVENLIKIFPRFCGLAYFQFQSLRGIAACLVRLLSGHITKFSRIAKIEIK